MVGADFVGDPAAAGQAQASTHRRRGRLPPGPPTRPSRGGEGADCRIGASCSYDRCHMVPAAYRRQTGFDGTYIAGRAQRPHDLAWHAETKEGVMEDTNGQLSSRLSEIERVVEQLVERVNAITQADVTGGMATRSTESIGTNWIPIPWIPVTPAPVPPPPPPPPPTSAPTPPPGPLPTPRPPVSSGYCTRCGNAVQPGWAYCGFCGTEL